MYKTFDESFPYKFDYPVYARVVKDTERSAEPYWINIEFPKYKGTIHISYKKISNSPQSTNQGQNKKGSQNNLKIYLEDSRNFAMKHMTKANSINESVINDRQNKIYGLVYNISGTGAASAYQFYLTDSTSRFLRGALYFKFKPNNDSIAPVIEFIKDDINHLIKTFRWR